MQPITKVQMLYKNRFISIVYKQYCVYKYFELDLFTVKWTSAVGFLEFLKNLYIYIYIYIYMYVCVYIMYVAPYILDAQFFEEI